MGADDIRPTPARAAIAFACLALGMTPALHAGARGLFPSPPALVTLIVAAMLSLAALAGAPAWRRTALCLAAIVFGLGWATLRTTGAPSGFLGARLDPSAPPIVTLEGVIVTPPEIGPAQRAGALSRFAPPIIVTRFRFDADTLIGASGAPSRVSGSFHVRIDEPAGPARIGDRVRITGKALPVGAPTNPGESDFRTRAVQDRIAGTLLVPAAGLIEFATTPAPPFDGARAAFLRLRASARGFIRRWIGSTAGDSADAGALLSSLLLGEREGGAHRLHGAFARIGLAHLLSISGLHLVAVAWGALLLLRLLGDRPRLETLIILLAVAGYCFIAPVRTPIARAAIMVVALLGAELAGRRYHPLAVLSLTAIAIILWRPTELASVGFQLSFGVVAALVVCTPRVERRLFRFDPPPDERTTAQAIGQKLRRLAIASVVAWAIATPLVAHRIGIVSPLAPALTLLLALPVTALLTGALGAVIVSAVIPPLSIVTGTLLTLLASAIAWVALVADAMPLSVIHVPTLSPLWAIAATLVIGWWLVVGERRNTPALLASALMLGWTGVALLPTGLPGGVALRVDALDVGDGSCLLVRAGGGSMLIDAGSDNFGFGLRTVPGALRALGAGRVNTAVVTHANLDHYNALPDAAGPIGLDRVIVSRDFLSGAEADPEGPVAAFLRDLRRQGVRIESVSAGDTITIGALTAHILSPPEPSPFDEANNNSIVLRLTTPTAGGDRTLLITGDIERPAMDRLFAEIPGLRADIAEAPHHGSAVTGSGGFLLRVDPRLVLQSTGPSRLDDPRLDDARAGRAWLVTARDGALWATVGRDGEVRGGSFTRPTRGSSRRP